MSSTVEQIKERLNIAEVVGSYLTLQKAGKNLRAKCPFHNEKTPSFFVNPDRGSYYCFGCGAKGDIFTFVEEYEKLDFPGALKVLADRAGVRIVRENRVAKEKTARIYECLEAATRFFEGRLTLQSEALDYLKNRGLSELSMKFWRLGFAPAAWRETLTHLQGKGYSEDELLRAGLVKKGEDGSRIYDRFRSRIMFPICDSSGRVVAFSGRIFGEEKGEEAKYLNSPETELFRKSATLFGLDKAKSAIRKNDFAIVVEGQMDVLLSVQAGYRNTVAASGTALTEEHLKILKRFTNRLVFAFDADRAGFEAALKSTKLALALGFEVKVAATPEGSDPADVAGKDPAMWKKAVGASRHIINFVLDKTKAANHSGRVLAEEIKRVVLPFVAVVENRIEQSKFVREISEEIGAIEEAVWDELKKVRVGASKEVSGDKVRKVSPNESLPLRHLCGILFWNESSAGDSSVEKEIKTGLVRILGVSQDREAPKAFASNRESLIFEVEREYDTKEKLAVGIKDLLLELERDTLRNEFALAMKALALAEKNRDDELAVKELKKCQEISKRLNQLNSVRRK